MCPVKNRARYKQAGTKPSAVVITLTEVLSVLYIMYALYYCNIQSDLIKQNRLYRLASYNMSVIFK